MAALAAASSRVAVRPAVAPRRSVVARAARPLWYPGADAPAYLNGTLAGDFGFDPLGLGKDPKALAWNQAAELFHCRLCMTAVAGVLIPDILTHMGILNTPLWTEASVAYQQSAGALPLPANLMATFFAVHFVEVKRYADIIKPGSQAQKGSFGGIEGAFAPKEPGYPGGFFDPLGFSKNAETWADWKLKEVKNGRLAMLAIIGFGNQAAAWPGKSPVDNLLEHVADPLHKTFAENGLSLPYFSIF